jgi:hypothetical protein
MPVRRTILLLLGALLITRGVSAQEPLNFVHPPPENAGDQRHSYYWEILEAALKANKERFGPYQLRAFDAPMTFARAASEVESGTGRVNIVARATNLELESRLRPIPIPLDKGLLGFRLFLIREAMQPQLAEVDTLTQLKQFSIGQSTPWTDTKILAGNGFKLELSDNYESLFRMLAAGRFDLFSRGVNEIHAEWLAHREALPELVIEERLLLQYPMPRYFFVPRTLEGERMAIRIEDGLNRLRRSGEFERRYQAYKKLVLRDVKLAGRKVFRLSNPQLSPLAPLADQYWWEDLSAELKPDAGTKGIPRKPSPRQAQ